MPKQIDKFGLRKSIVLSFSLTVLVLEAVTFLFVGGRIDDAMERPLLQRAQRQATQLAGDLESVVLGVEQQRTLAILDRRLAGEDGGAAIVVRPDGTVAASRLGPGMDRADAIVAEHDRQNHPRCFHGDGTLWCADGTGVADPSGAAPRADAELNTKGRARVLVGLSTGVTEKQAADLKRLSVTVLGALGLILLALFLYLQTHFVSRPLSEMREVARRVCESDLSARAPKLSNDEMGSLADSLNRIGENLTTTVGRVQGVVESVGTIIDRITRTGKSVSADVGTISARVIETDGSMNEMISSFKGIANNVEALAQSAEESSSSILEMAATNDEVAENIKSLAASVSETTAAIEEMTFSIKEVAKNIEALSATAEETSSSMNEMDVSIGQVESNANETAKLSEQAQKDAESGAEALSRTLAGIDKIKGSSKEAASVIEALGKKIATVGNILSVIDDVAEQTNLLALNAAILAAQSGEHGKGFAVVADEIKDLAERTGASTKEISELIRSIQEESKNAVQAMDRGVKNVEEGVRLGQEAESALKKIQESSEKSTQMVKAIARATIEQARGSKQVTVAINRIAETVQQIATATAEQARGSEQIMKSAEKMKIITKHVERSSEEQARGSKQITKAIESISEMVNHLNRAQKDQMRGSEQVMSAVIEIKNVAEAQTASVRELEQAIVDLADQAGVLGGEVSKFKM